MLTVRIFDIQYHRNETTFRPYLACADMFEDIGIDFIFEGNKYDLAWVGQQTFSDKNYLLPESLSRGLYKLQPVSGDYILFDGQDSASLIGTYGVFKNSNAKLLLKNTLYRSKDDYAKSSIHGRTYWGQPSDYAGQKFETQTRVPTWNSGMVVPADEYEFSIPDLDLTGVKLSGANWLSTMNPQWFDIREKDIDVFAMFQYPAKYNEEFCRPTHYFYDAHRSHCINWINNLPASLKVAKLDAGKKVPIEEYYALMRRSKIVIAPFGYGEMAPRDIESAMLNAILIKPDMGHLESIPNPYIPEVTYRPCKWDYSDLNDVILDTLDHYDEYRDYFVSNLRTEYIKQYNPENLVRYMHEIICGLDGYGTV